MALNPKDTAGFSVSDAGAVTATAYNTTPRTVAASAALVIGPTDSTIYVSSTGGASVLGTHAMVSGQRVAIVMTAFNTGVYTLAVRASGTLTLNATLESAILEYDGTDIQVLALNGATVV